MGMTDELLSWVSQKDRRDNYCHTCYKPWTDDAEDEAWSICDCCLEGQTWNACTDPKCGLVLSWHEDLQRLESDRAEAAKRMGSSAPASPPAKKRRLESNK